MTKTALIVFCVLVVIGMIAAEILFCRDPKKNTRQSDDSTDKNSKSEK